MILLLGLCLAYVETLSLRALYVSLLLELRSHLESYPTPKNINFLWNKGFLLALTMVLQIFTGIILSMHYTSNIVSAYNSLMHMSREVYLGWTFRSIHSIGASVIHWFVSIHYLRALITGSSFYLSKIWFSGIILFLYLMATAFLGYVLPFGQMSFWAATVVTNLFSCLPCLVIWIYGSYLVSSPALSRFFVIHFGLPLLISGVISVHLFYLHLISSNNPLGYNTNNKIPFFPFIFSKDLFGFSLSLHFHFC